jgi:succinate-acetate transporter protein
MDNKFANPAPLGLIGFAATTWLLSMINAGWFGKDSMALVLAMALAFGGGAQMLAVCCRISAAIPLPQSPS